MNFTTKLRHLFALADEGNDFDNNDKDGGKEHTMSNVVSLR